LIQRALLGVLAGAALLSAPAAAGGRIPVDVELVLMVDVSGSVDLEEARLQRNGYVEALKSRKVIDAIHAGPTGRIAVAYVEWADATFQKVVLDWTLIDSAESAEAAAATLKAAPIATAFWTSLGAAISFGGSMIEGNGFEGDRKVIDVSGDGYNNRGPEPDKARDLVAARGITINGLPIVGHVGSNGAGPPKDLDRYYIDHVIGGPGAFVQAAEGFDAFGAAILTKLVSEVAGVMPPATTTRSASR
jgi:hypothetical protein